MISVLKESSKIPLSSIIDRIKPIPLDDDMLAAGRSLGICFGD